MGVDRTRTIDDDVGGVETTGLQKKPGVIAIFSEAPLPGDAVYAARTEMTVGRSADCTIFVEDPGMSRHHASFCFDGAALSIKDADSRNGTFVNGDRIRERVLERDCSIARCGQTLLMPVSDVTCFEGWRRWGLENTLVGGPAIKAVLAEVGAFARSGLDVLITGESGTGKELVAEELHRQSGRKGPFIAVNCAALPESLFEAELFGAKKGAYTGASEERRGLLVDADNGTLFLDELGELPLASQAKLLRAVDQREVRPVGGTRPVRVDVRIVAATNRDLKVEVERERFRADLYHRLYGAWIDLPPLRERLEDIPLLLTRVLSSHGDRPIATAFVERLLGYTWPGNVRELDRVAREAVARAKGDGAKKVLPRHLRDEVCWPTLAPRDEQLEAIKAALAKHRGNVSRVAAELGMHRARIYALLRERGVRAEDFR